MTTQLSRATAEVRVPPLGQGIDVGTITRWLKSEGDAVAVGDPLYEIETDKVTQEVEATADGVLVRIAVAAGEARVGETVGLVETTGAAPAPATPAHRVGVRRASPLARRMAREHGVDLETLAGSGPDAHVVARDVVQAVAAAVSPPPPRATVNDDVVALTSVRRTIARRLTEAWQVPVFQLTASVDMTQTAAIVRRMRELAPDTGPTVTDVIAKTCAAALRHHPALNARVEDDVLHRSRSVHLGIAVDAPTGLVVPVVRSVELLSLTQFAVARSDVVTRAREGHLKQDDLDGGTFTISNLGMFGVEQFIAVLNPPQAAILAVGATEDRPVVRAGAVVVRPMLTMTLTVDHRAVDGAEAAAFLRLLQAYLQEPGLSL